MWFENTTCTKELSLRFVSRRWRKYRKRLSDVFVKSTLPLGQLIYVRFTLMHDLTLPDLHDLMGNGNVENVWRDKKKTENICSHLYVVSRVIFRSPLLMDTTLIGGNLKVANKQAYIIPETAIPRFVSLTISPLLPVSHYNTKRGKRHG